MAVGGRHPCPKCGHELEQGTPICGNCGTIQGGGPHVPQPLAAAGIRPGAVITVGLVLALTAGAFFARGAIADLFRSVDTAVEDATGGAAGEQDPPDIGGGGAATPGGKSDKGPRVPIGYRHVPQVVADLRAGGIPCTSTQVASADGYVESGSCQSNGSHVQINLYFDPGSMKLARQFYAEFAFASVHADNWWVSGETALMERIQKVLGGKLNRP